MVLIAEGGDKFLKLRATTNIEQKKRKKAASAPCLTFIDSLIMKAVINGKRELIRGVTPPVFILFSFAFYVG